MLRRLGVEVKLFHGGVPDLRVGDVIAPGHPRGHEKCPWCEARAAAAGLDMDGPPHHLLRIYATSHRLYAKQCASLLGYGDLYRVTTDGDVKPCDEYSFDTVVAERLIVAAVLDRAVLLTASEQRRLTRECKTAEKARKVPN